MKRKSLTIVIVTLCVGIAFLPSFTGKSSFLLERTAENLTTEEFEEKNFEDNFIDNEYLQHNNDYPYLICKMLALLYNFSKNVNKFVLKFDPILNEIGYIVGDIYYKLCMSGNTFAARIILQTYAAFLFIFTIPYDISDYMTMISYNFGQYFDCPMCWFD